MLGIEWDDRGLRIGGELFSYGALLVMLVGGVVTSTIASGLVCIVGRCFALIRRINNKLSEPYKRQRAMICRTKVPIRAILGNWALVSLMIWIIAVLALIVNGTWHFLWVRWTLLPIMFAIFVFCQKRIFAFYMSLWTVNEQADGEPAEKLKAVEDNAMANATFMGLCLLVLFSLLVMAGHAFPLPACLKFLTFDE